ncbi:hypothetical protein [Bradyrhizobium sp. 63_E2_N1_3]|uniref:hypothetical protein n=1 Tax=Bradyrhizobium sp. 63_E2_N1_3 TaxID=3240373 RepID=UPI003F8B7FE0
MPRAEAALPAGPFESFEQAVQSLRPISTMHRLSEFGERQHCACVSCAANEVQRLAIELNQNKLLERDAPRAKHVVDGANLVAQCADQLLKAIKGTDDYTRKAFMEYGRYSSVQDLPTYSGQFDNFEEDDDYPDPADDDNESLWIQNLLELRQGARLVAAEFKKSRGAERSAPIDKGGRTNLFKEGFGSPDRNLVISGWSVFETFLHKQAKGTEHGAFHEFLKHVFKYATGRSSERHSSIGSWVKALASLLRQRDDASELYLSAERLYQELKAEPHSNLLTKHKLALTMKEAADTLDILNSRIRSAKLSKKARQK